MTNVLTTYFDRRGKIKQVRALLGAVNPQHGKIDLRALDNDQLSVLHCAAWEILKKEYTPADLLSTFSLNQPTHKDWSTATAIREGFKVSTWVYDCVRKRMDSIAAPEYKVQKWNRNAWQDNEDNKLAELLARPNSYQTWEELLQTVQSHLDLGGNAIILKNRPRPEDGIRGGLPVNLQVFPPDQIAPVPSATLFIAYYELTINGKKIKISPENIIHFRYVDPANAIWGVSPLQAGAKVVDVDVAAVEWNFNMMSNRGRPSGILQVKNLRSEEELKIIQGYIDSYISGTSNAGNTAIINKETDYTQLDQTPVEADFNQSRRQLLEEICSLYGVSPILLGILENSTFANYATARLAFWEDTIMPLLDAVLMPTWNRYLTFEYGSQFRIAYDLSGIPAMFDSLAKKTDIAVKHTSMGVPFNLVNREIGLGYPSIPGGDVGYVAATMLPATSDPESVNSPVKKIAREFEEVA